MVGPRARPVVERLDGLAKRLAQGGEPVAGIVVLYDEPGRGQFGQPLVHDAGRHRVAALPQLAGAARAVAKLPEDPQRPPPPEQVERCHQRSSGGRPQHRPARPGSVHGHSHGLTFRIQ